MARKMLKQGAEACLYLSEFMGRKALEKERRSKGYRVKELDQSIRQNRLKVEALLLHKAKKAGVRTPILFQVDKKKSSLLMEFIEGEMLKDVLKGKPAAKKKLKYCFDLGKNIGLLHQANIMHGDLTTSNVVLKDGCLAFIDFGLGFESGKLEDKAMDLVVLKKTFNATHHEIKNGWQKILQGYIKQTKNKNIEKAIERIEKRVRYH